MAVRPGQRVRFLYTLGKPGVSAWDVPASQTAPGRPDIRSIDLPRYRVLLQRAIQTVLAPIQQAYPEADQAPVLYLFPAMAGSAVNA